MLVPFGDVGKAQAALEDDAEEIEPVSPPPVQERGRDPDKRFVMRHPDTPLGRRRGYYFECQGEVLRVVNGETVVDAETADILEKSGWIRKEAMR